MKKNLDILAHDLISNGFAIFEINTYLKSAIQDIFSEAYSFFSLSLDEKIISASPQLLEGYRAIGIEYSQTPDRPDLNDSFSVWKRNLNNSLIIDWAIKNQLHKAMSSSIILYEELVNGIFDALLSQINKNGQPIKASNQSYLQINHYEPWKYDRDFLQDSHEDGHLLTIVKSNMPGLEIKINDDFYPISLKENEIFIMPGSILTFITGGLIPPLYHRVRNNNSALVRQSIMYFANPLLDFKQTPWVENETNTGIDICKVIRENSTHFGLPIIGDI